MRFNRSLIYYATLVGTSLLCFNFKTIASSEPSGPFDIPLTTTFFDDNETNDNESRHLRANANLHTIHELNHNGHESSYKPIPLTEEEVADIRKHRTERMQERRAKAKKVIMEHQPDIGQLERMSNEEVRKVYGNAIKNDPNLEDENHKWMKTLGRHLRSSSEEETIMADPGGYYEKWAQGYRMLGGYIDCDNSKDQGGSHDKNKNNGGGGQGACSRWMVWAAYVNPNYQGGGRSEYFSNNEYYDAVSTLDCHSPNTEWKLLGVYRQEFYQYIEQISKHLWAIDDYEYVVALAGLAYMTDEDCYAVGYDSYGNTLYAGVQPYGAGYFQMSLYTDAQCVTLDTDSGKTFDDFGRTNSMDLGSKDDGTLSDDTLYTLYGYWKKTQEYTLTLLNEVYEEYKYCTLCMDYPTYQDGYFIGDSGTDDDDLINQCWKFHSHDSFVCDSTCMALADAQGSITRVDVGSAHFGQSWDGSYGSSSSSSSSSSGSKSSGYRASSANSKFQKFKANAYLTFNGILFIATFLAFSVARGNQSSDISDKKRSLLSREERRAAKSPRSSSGSRKSSKSKKSSSTKSKKSSSASRASSRSKSRKRESSTSRKASGTYA